jgi:hypothetical protein
MLNKEKLMKTIQDVADAPTPEEKEKAVEKAAKEVEGIPDTPVYRTIVWMLGIAILLAAVALATLAGLGKTIPEALTAIASAAVGALAGAISFK